MAPLPAHFHHVRSQCNSLLVLFLSFPLQLPLHLRLLPPLTCESLSALCTTDVCLESCDAIYNLLRRDGRQEYFQSLVLVPNEIQVRPKILQLFPALMIVLGSCEVLLRDSSNFRHTLQFHGVGFNPFLELLEERGILLLQHQILDLQCRPSGLVQILLLRKATMRPLLRNVQGCLLLLQTFDLGFELCPRGSESCFLILEAIPVASVHVVDVGEKRIVLCLQDVSEGCLLFLETIDLSTESCPSIHVPALFPCNLLPVASLLLVHVVEQRAALCLQG
mmetsp:Transcript_78550/g.253947  ORF Transcript_78550/g.253947 Transcript_78550/m.253947 type:complete len:278 (-) Transcript_78550:433-1266(-)